MHILLSVLGAVGTIAFILWRVQQASYIAREIADAAGSARGVFRRWRWRRKANVNPIDLIEDPREAAGVIMVAVAQADGRLTAAEQGAICNQIRQRFDATHEQAGELLAQAQWLVREGVDTREVMRRTMPVIQKLGREQRRELIE
ncbi:MAG: TerB family tellurite resistance protein, partial [Hyphomicrobiaceae bacterium]